MNLWGGGASPSPFSLLEQTALATETMVYRVPGDDARPDRIIENEHGKWEWQIVDLEDGESPPAGWQSFPYAAETPAPPAKKPRTKKPDAVTEEGTPDGDSD